MLFGPSKKQLKSYVSWEGCDGSFFFPYGKQDKIGKISDFVTAATLAKKADEKALDAPKSVKDAAAKRAQASKGLKEETKGEPVEEDVPEDAFTVVEEKGARINREKKQQWNKNQNYNNWNQ